MTAATVTSSARSSAARRPLGERVVVQPPGREEMTKRGIVLPDAAAEMPQEGSTIAVGPIPGPAALEEPTSGYDRRTT